MNKTNLNPKVFRDYINSNDYWNSHVFLFLQGRNDNLVGTVVGCSTVWRENYQGEKDFYSCLIYFDHTTARIERYLVNVQFTESTFNKEFFDYCDSIILQHYLPDTYRYKEELSTGKLDKQFLNIFLMELLEDYLIYQSSSFYPNMARFHRLLDYDDAYPYPKFEDLSQNFISKPITKFNINKKNIVIPNQFNLQEVKSEFKQYTNYNFIHHGKSSYPFVISIIKNFIYDSPYQDIDQLDTIIKDLNNFIAEQIYLIDTDPQAREKFSERNKIWENSLVDNDQK